MATTTNYGWTTPNDTDLVKDGAAAIRTLGSSIDTTTKNLNPSTTLGDLEYRSATANTNTRLAIGSNGQYLTVTGGVPAWGAISAGGMTLLSTTTLSGASTTISSINQTYTNLMVFVYGVTNSGSNGLFRVAPNADTGITTMGSLSNNTTVRQNSNSYLWLAGPGITGEFNTDRTSANNFFRFEIQNYSNATNYKGVSVNSVFLNSVTAANAGWWSFGGIQTNDAITSLVFSNDGGNLSTGTVLVYGVK
jgi:hypothetical protein